MATYGRDSKGEYKIRDDGTKVYRTPENTKYFPTDYGGTAGWSTGGSASSGSGTSGTNKSSSGSKSSSKSSGSSGGGSWNYNDQNWNDASWVNSYINHMISQGDAARAAGQDYMKYYNEAQRVKDASIQKGVLPPYNYVGGSTGGGNSPSGGEGGQQQFQGLDAWIAEALKMQQGMMGWEAPQYNFEPVPRLSYEEAVSRARAYIDPLYADLEQQAAEQALKDGVARGLNDAALQGFVQEARLRVQEARGQALTAYAENLMRESEQLAMAQEQANFQRWLGQQGLNAEYAGMNMQNMNSLLGNLFGWGNLQTQQGYLQETQRMNDWTRNVQFPQQMNLQQEQLLLQKRGMELEEMVQDWMMNVQFPAEMELRWYDAKTGRIQANKIGRGGSSGGNNPWGLNNIGDLAAAVSVDVSNVLEDVADGAYLGDILKNFKDKESKGLLPQGYSKLVEDSVKNLAPSIYNAYYTDLMVQHQNAAYRGTQPSVAEINAKYPNSKYAQQAAPEYGANIVNRIYNPYGLPANVGLEHLYRNW